MACDYTWPGGSDEIRAALGNQNPDPSDPRYLPPPDCGLIMTPLVLQQLQAWRGAWLHEPLLFIRLLGALRLVGEITRFDGPASVLRAYTLDEARALTANIKARSGRVVRAFPFRFGILLRK